MTRALLTFLLILIQTSCATAQPDDRMSWWRDARFGLFIHWGLYAIPAGEWDGATVGGVGEWIRHIGQIPSAEYDTLVSQFDPVEFDADEWARVAREAGMRYVVITTKHHDGFALFDSAVSGYDVMATPFRRDIMKELVDACRRRDVRIGWYHSILDWHHVDYVPKRSHMEQNPDADFERYVAHLHAQVTELLTNYGPIDIMWFDGEWDASWTHEHGLALDTLVRSLQPDIVVNNRVGKARYHDDSTSDLDFPGDFGTPEQHIPATGLPGVDWETCLTMNDTWGFRRDDQNWKSADELLRALIDIASKGGNFLLNVGPTAEGRIPTPSVDRLSAIGAWLECNGESIYGTRASPLGTPDWGRCTMRADADRTRLYLHVFDWPESGELVVHGIANEALGASILGAPAQGEPLATTRREDALVIRLPSRPLQADITVIALDIRGAPEVVAPPRLISTLDRFVDSIDVNIGHDLESGLANRTVRYTLDGTPPTSESPIAPSRLTLRASATVSARLFDGDRPISGARQLVVSRVEPIKGLVTTAPLERGIVWTSFNGDCNSVADIAGLEASGTGASDTLGLPPNQPDDHFAVKYDGWIEITRDGMYRFGLSSDDGSTLHVANRLVVDHDGIHAAYDIVGAIALGEGLHHFRVDFFEKGGDASLDLWIEGPGLARTAVDGRFLRRRP